MKELVLACAIALLAFESGARPSHAHSYPPQPIRIVMPCLPVWTNDSMRRPRAVPLCRAIYLQVMVDNRGGTNGVIGAEAVSRAPAVGYIILFHSITSHGTKL